MRDLRYVLADGSMVNTYPETVSSRQKFKEVMLDIPHKSSGVTPRREACLKQYGRVTPELMKTIA